MSQEGPAAKLCCNGYQHHPSHCQPNIQAQLRPACHAVLSTNSQGGLLRCGNICSKSCSERMEPTPPAWVLADGVAELGLLTDGCWAG